MPSLISTKSGDCPHFLFHGVGYIVTAKGVAEAFVGAETAPIGGFWAMADALHSFIAGGNLMATGAVGMWGGYQLLNDTYEIVCEDSCEKQK